jgi:hypothetical protein
MKAARSRRRGPAVNVPMILAEIATLTGERDRARSIAAGLEAELESALRNLDAARGEIARLSASEASASASARQNTAGLR